MRDDARRAHFSTGCSASANDVRALRRLAALSADAAHAGDRGQRSGDARAAVGARLRRAVAGAFGAEAEERALRSLRSLVEILLPRGWRFVDGFDNPMLAALAGGPAPGAPPNLTRYLTMLQEIARAATPVTIAAKDDDEGQKLMTLLFVDGKYVGFSRRDAEGAPGYSP